MAAIASDELSRLLASPLLAGADDGARIALFQSLVQANLAAGRPLLVQGQPNDRLWFTLEGGFEVERQQADGRSVVLATLTGPAMFGTTTFFRATAPSATIRVRSDVKVWTLDPRSHARLRQENPRAAEALALEVVRVLSERFDQLDGRLAEMMAEHGDDHPRSTEWASFRTRLFEEPSI